jgi:hypothetical protein
MLKPKTASDSATAGEGGRHALLAEGHARAAVPG